MTKSINVVLYTRVANAEQEKIKSELQEQEIILRNYCDTKGYKVQEVIREISSGTETMRPELNVLYTYVFDNRDNIGKVLLTTWDRTSRDVEQTIDVIKKFQKIGVEVQTVNQAKDMSNREHQFALWVYLTHDMMLQFKINNNK